MLIAIAHKTRVCSLIYANKKKKKKNEGKAKFYTFDELEEIIQASREELRHSLKKRGAIEIEGINIYIYIK